MRLQKHISLPSLKKKEIDGSEKVKLQSWQMGGGIRAVHVETDSGDVVEYDTKDRFLFRKNDFININMIVDINRQARSRSTSSPTCSAFRFRTSSYFQHFHWAYSRVECRDGSALAIHFHTSWLSQSFHRNNHEDLGQ